MGIFYVGAIHELPCFYEGIFRAIRESPLPFIAVIKTKISLPRTPIQLYRNHTEKFSLFRKKRALTLRITYATIYD